MGPASSHVRMFRILPKSRSGRLVLVAAAVAVVGVICWRPALRSVWLHQARRHLSARDAQAALRLLDRAQRLDPQHAETEFLLARACRRLGDLERARKHIERAWRGGFPVRRLEREQWLALAQAGQLRDAEPHLTKLLMDPQGDGPEICEAYVNGYLATYRFRDALGLLEAWHADYPDDPQPWYLRGMYAIHRGKDQEALDAFEEALKRAPERHEVRRHLGRIHLKLHQYERAAVQFEESLRHQPDNPDARAGWGECLLALGRVDEARRALDELLSEHSSNLGGRIAMARVELQSGRPREALRWVEPVVEERPTDYSARFVLASALRATGDSEAARAHFAYVEEAQRALDRARSLMDRVASEPDVVTLRYDIGTILLKYGLASEGAGWLRSVLDIQPEHGATHAALAGYYSSIGIPDLAERHRRSSGNASTPVSADDLSRGS